MDILSPPTGVAVTKGSVFVGNLTDVGFDDTVGLEEDISVGLPDWKTCDGELGNIVGSEAIIVGLSDWKYCDVFVGLPDWKTCVGELDNIVGSEEDILLGLSECTS